MLKRKIFCAVMVILLMSSYPIFAKEASIPGKPPTKAVVFLLDASGSMRNNDKDLLAIDSIAQLLYSLPSNYQVGAVAYNNEVVCETAMVDSQARGVVMKQVNAVKYNGNTNAGAGLDCAVALLSTVQAEEKSIIILSDGEITMGNEQETVASVELFESAVSKAVNGKVKIHVIGLGGDMTDSNNTIFSASATTFGTKYYAPKATDIQNAVDTIRMKQLQVKKTSASIVNASGETENLLVKIPFANASKVRILFTSTAPITNLKANFSAISGQQVSGMHYSLIEMNHPTTDAVEISFQGQKGSQVQVYLIAEYEVMAKTTVHYIDTAPAEGDATHYDRLAEVTMKFYDAQNPNIQLFSEAYFDDNVIALTVNQKDTAAALSEGTVTFTQPVTNDISLSITLGFSALPVNVLCDTAPMEIALEAAPPLPLPPDYRPYIIAGIVGGIGLAIAILLLLMRWQRHKPLPVPEPSAPVPSKYSYVGKLNLYITKSPSGYDIPPVAFNLFRLSSNRVISLQEVLNDCNVDEIFEGAGKIFLKPGANRTLVLTNNSDCTIMRNREVMLKNRSYELPVDSKVDITFEDEQSELAFQYRDLKPSAQHV